MSNTTRSRTPAKSARKKAQSPRKVETRKSAPSSARSAKAGAKKSPPARRDATATRTARKAPRKATRKASGSSTARKPARKVAPKANEARSSKRVMEPTAALDLQPGVFVEADPTVLSRSHEQLAERSTRRKAGPLQSAMSLLNFYLNRGGENLSASRTVVFERAKKRLREVFPRAWQAAGE